jgi:Transposase DDE domain
MIKQAVEHLNPVMSKSAATLSRAGVTLSVDNSVIDRFGKLLRCTWSWYSGRCHDVVRGQDLFGIVLTINHIALPLYLLFCSKQGRYNTTKADVLVSMLSRLKTEFQQCDIDLTKIPLTLDSWFVSQSLRQRLHELGFTKIIIAGKSNYTCIIDGKKQDAARWKKDLVLHDPTWGIDVPAHRVHAQSPTFGALILVFFQKSTTRSYYVMNFSQVSMRGAEIWHIWKQHHLIECFWKILKSIFHIRAMHLPGHGLSTALLIKVLAYMLAMRVQAHRPFSKLTITQIMRTLSRDHDLGTLLTEHFHLPFLAT